MGLWPQRADSEPHPRQHQAGRRHSVSLGVAERGSAYKAVGEGAGLKLVGEVEVIGVERCTDEHRGIRPVLSALFLFPFYIITWYTNCYQPLKPTNKKNIVPVRATNPSVAHGVRSPIDGPFERSFLRIVGGQNQTHSRVKCHPVT